MSGWSTILAYGPPVVGEPADYLVAAERCQHLRQTAEQVVAAFCQVTYCGDYLQGKAADALRDVVADVDDSLKYLPIVLLDVTRVLRDHEADLELLRQSTQRALARAKVRWNTLQEAERTVDNERRELSSLESARNNTPSIPENEPYIAQLNSLIASQVSHLHKSQLRRDDAMAAICVNMTLGKHPENCSGASDAPNVSLNSTSCYEHMSLRNQERILVGRTVRRLEDVDLRGIRDPNWLERVASWMADRVSGIGEWLADFVDDLGKSIVHALAGEWGKALHYLRDVLEKAIVILTVAALVVGTIFTGGAVLAGVAMALAGLRLGISYGLGLMQTPHPETDQPISPLEWLVDAGLVFIGGAVAKHGVRLANQSLKNLLKQSSLTRGLSRKLISSKVAFSKKYLLRALRDVGPQWQIPKQPWIRMVKQFQLPNVHGNYRGVHLTRRALRLEFAEQLTENFVLPVVATKLLLGQEYSVNKYLTNGPSLGKDVAVPLVCGK